MTYYGLIAAPIFESESILRVSSPASSQKGDTSSGASMMGKSNASANTWMLKDRLESWGAFQHINSQYNIADIYAGGDFVARSGGLSSLWHRGSGDVATRGYFNRSFDLKIDEDTGNAKLTVTGWTPDAATDIANALVSDATESLNQLNAREDGEAIKAGEREVSRLTKALEADDLAISQWRGRIGILDPKIDYTSLSQKQEELDVKRIEMSGQYNALTKYTPNSPSAVPVQAQIDALIDGLKNAAGDARNMIQEAAIYEGLDIRRKADAKLLSSAEEALQESRLKASQSHYYVEVISPPSKPQAASGPYRLKWIGIVFVISMIFFFVLG
ncbi:hypothetical protein [Acetobacter persici]|nr:hypothetical protein [Acetobacter persici]